MANYEHNALRNAIYLADLVTKTDATSNVAKTDATSNVAKTDATSNVAKADLTLDANAIANDALNAEVYDALDAAIDAKIEVNDSKITLAIL